MTDEQLDNAFNEAQEQWLAANKGTGYSSTQQRYFFGPVLNLDWQPRKMFTANRTASPRLKQRESR